MTDLPLRIGVVGVQGIGRLHLGLLDLMRERFTVTAVCDIDADAAAATGAELGARAFTSAEELFGSGEVDAVVLAVAPALHRQLAEQALAAGLHVYCEKPLAPLASDGLAIASAADTAGRVVQVGFQHRFQPSYAIAHRLLRGGEIGEVFRANVTSTRWFRPRGYFTRKPWRGRWETVGGGVLLTQAIHTLDAYVWLVGMPSRVWAQAWRSLHDGCQVEQEVTALLAHPHGARGLLTASVVDPVGRNRLELHGTDGTLVADGQGLHLGRLQVPLADLLDGVDDYADVAVSWESLVAPRSEEGDPVPELIRECLIDFAGAIAEGRRPRNHPAEANRAVELANAIYLAAATDQPVDLPLDHDAYREVFADLVAGRRAISVVGHG